LASPEGTDDLTGEMAETPEDDSHILEEENEAMPKPEDTASKQPEITSALDDRKPRDFPWAGAGATLLTMGGGAAIFVNIQKIRKR
jgi:hypothetical protein